MAEPNIVPSATLAAQKPPPSFPPGSEDKKESSLDTDAPTVENEDIPTSGKVPEPPPSPPNVVEEDEASIQSEIGESF